MSMLTAEAWMYKYTIEMVQYWLPLKEEVNKFREA